MTLTTDKASHTTFILTRFKTGYSTQEVDAFMQEFIAALRSWETGTPYGVLTSRDVTSRTFTPTRFRHGYEQGGVDAFMQEAAATLQAWETGTITGPPDDDRRPSGYGSQPVGAPQPVGIAQQASTPAGVLTSQEVMNAKFSATRFSEGYEQDEIDEFLDEITETLRAWEKRTAAGASQSADAPSGMLTSQDVLNKKFSVGKFFEGYEQSEVDAFLDEIMRALRNYAARAGR